MLLSISFVGVLKTLLLVLFMLSALLLTLIVLLQEPKGGGLAAAFGGAGAETFGVQSGSVNKFTTYVAGVFLTLAVLYAMIRPGGDDAASTDSTIIGAPENAGGGGCGDGCGEDDE